MKKIAEYRQDTTVLLLCFIAFLHPAASAEVVYKCVEGGKTRFTSSAGEPGCQPIELNVPQPNPIDVARQQEQNREYERQEMARDKQRREASKNSPEAQRRQQVTKLGEAVAHAPVPKLPNNSGRGKKKGSSRY